jgi:predicted small integral membrane protein
LKVSVSVKTSVATSGAGTATILLGDMAQLSVEGWAILAIVVLLSVMAGSGARLAQMQNRKGVTVERITRERRYAVGILASQFAFGLVIAALAGGNLWTAIPGCLVLGWTGAVFLRAISRRWGFDDDQENGAS